MKPTVLVIEASAKAALTAIQSLHRRGCHVIAAAEHGLVSGFFSRCCHERLVYPSAQHTSAAFQGWLLDLLATRTIDVVFPVGHYGSVAVSEIQDAVRRHSRLVLPGHDIFMRGYAKIGTLQAALSAGVPIPRSWFPASHPGGLAGCLAEVECWPVLVKPSVGVGARGITWCHSADEVRACFSELEARHGACFLQDFVPSGGMQYKADLLLDRGGELLAGVVYEKRRMYPPDGGSSVLNVSVRRPDIVAHAHAVLSELGWIGFCDFDFVLDPRDERVYLMEINPRFPESLRAATCTGVDLPGMLLDLSLGRPVAPVAEYPEGRVMRFLPGDLLWWLAVGREQRQCTDPPFHRFVGPELTYQLVNLHDPGPLLGYLIENAALAARGRFFSERMQR